MKIVVTHANNFDFRNHLYAPLRGSVLNGQHKIYLPYEDDAVKNTKDLIKDCDVMVAEVSSPSTGQGIELGWANALGKKIICMYRPGSTVSRSLQFIATHIFEYGDTGDMVNKLNESLTKIEIPG